MLDNLVIHSYKMILCCPFARSNKCNITLKNNNQIIRFVVDQFIGSTFYADRTLTVPWFGLHAADPEKKQCPPHSMIRPTKKKTLISG